MKLATAQTYVQVWGLGCARSLDYRSYLHPTLEPFDVPLKLKNLLWAPCTNLLQ